MKTIGAGIVGSATLTGSVTASRGRGGGPRNVVSIEAKHPEDNGDHYIFDFSTTEIESGWTTFILENQSGSTHLAPTFRYTPETVDTIDTIVEYGGNNIDSRREAQIELVAKPFQKAFDLYWKGDIDMPTFFADLFAAIGAAREDAWPGDPDDIVWEGVPVGGPGLIQGHHTGRTTMNLEPGVYYMECYVLDDQGTFHTDHMVETFVVTEGDSNAAEPNPDVEVTIDSEDGLDLDGSIDRPGRYRFGVTFGDNVNYLHGLGHDVNLIRLDEDTHSDDDGPEKKDVNIWVDWLDAVPGTIDDEPTLVYGDRGALTSTSAHPGPGTWLGGVQDISPTDAHPTGYFEASLKPGDYALVAEVPNPMLAQPLDDDFQPIGDPVSMVEEFTVTSSGRRGK